MNEETCKLKLEALRIIGRGQLKCVNCSISDIRVLTINHMKGGGSKEAKKSDWGWNRAYKKIISGERPIDDLDLRCYNCQILYEYERGHRTMPQIV